MISLTVLSICLGCVSAVDWDDANSTAIATDDNSRMNINEINSEEIIKEDTLFLNNDDEELSADITPEVTITDKAHTAEVNNITKGTSVSIDIVMTANFNYHYDDKIVDIYVGDKIVETKTLSYVSSDVRSGTFSYTFNTDGTYEVKVISQAYPGYSVSYGQGISNIITYVVGNASGANSTGGEVNQSTQSNASASISIYDIAYPSQSTIASNGDYVADIAYTITKSGDAFSNEALDVIVNGASIGSTTPNTSNRLGNLTFDEDNTWIVTVVYSATVNGQTLTATSNALTFVTRNTSGGNSTGGDDNQSTESNASASISIYDIAYPSQSTITSNGDYVADIAYTITKSGDGFSNEALDVIVNGASIGSTTPNTSNRLGNLTFDEDNTWIVTVVYSATVNGQTVTATSNTLTFVTRNTSGGNSTGGGDNPSEDINTTDVKVIIRDANYPNNSVITVDDVYTPALQYYVVYPSSGNVLKTDLIILNGGLGVLTIDDPAASTWTTISGLGILYNESGQYTVNAELLISMFMSDTSSYDVYSNTLTYKVTVSNETPAATPTLSISVDNVEYPNQATATVTSNVDGDYVLSVGGTDYDISLSGGKASISFSIAVGTYTATVTSKTNSSLKNSTTFSVTKSQVSADTALNIETQSGSNTTSYSINLPSDATGTFTVTVDGDKSYSQTLKDGSATVTVDDLSEGTHSVVINYSGDSNYNSITRTTTVIVNSTSAVINGSSENTFTGSTIVASDLTRAYNSSYDFKATFYDKNGNLLKDTEVNFIVNGNDHIIRTDEYGVAKLVNTLSVANYSIEIKNLATGESLTKNANIVSRITENANVKADYSYAVSYKVRLYADNGQAVGAGESVSFLLNKVTYTAITDSNGYATLKVKNSKLIPKKYTVKATYKGVTVSNKVVVKQILKATNKKFKKSAKTKKYTATLKTTAGKAIKSKKITFKIKGKTYKAKTNKKGVATIKIKQSLKAGKYKITIKYLKTSIKKTITIKK